MLLRTSEPFSNPRVQWYKIVKPEVELAVEVSGEDILVVLAAAAHPTRAILAGGFEVIFGLKPEEWGAATMEQRRKRLNLGALLCIIRCATD